jgi:glycosyltransferase involved in cell wall biosynthesis
MKLVVISHKECWRSPDSPSGYATVGGFPAQMAALSECFDATRLVIAEYAPPMPSGALPLVGYNLTVAPLPRPAGTDWRRKLALITWLPRFLPRLWREIAQADAVHAPVPGDIGTLGLLIAWVQRKRLFVRHCGTWGHRGTVAERFLAWLLPRIAGGRTVVMATGGADSPPEPGNPAVTWIFSTTLSEAEIAHIPAPEPWKSGEALRLVTVGRLSAGKNTQAMIRALPVIREQHPGVTLSVVGDGPMRGELESLAESLGVREAVTFHGSVPHDEVLRILQGSHLFVFPTRVAEGFPKAVQEALACGLPVIAPPVSVIPQLLRDGGGVLLHDTTPATVAHTVLDVAGDEARFAAMGRAAYAAGREYTLEGWRGIIAQRLESAWGRLKILDGR